MVEECYDIMENFYTTEIHVIENLGGKSLEDRACMDKLNSSGLVRIGRIKHTRQSKHFPLRIRV